MSEADSQQLPVVAVPEKHAVALSKFASLPDDKQKAIYQAAGEIPPSTLAWDALKSVVDAQLALSAEDAKGLAAAIMGLFYVRQRASDRTDSEFVQATIRGIQKAAPKASASDSDLQKTLVNVLALRNLELAYRAGRVRFDHAHHLHDAGIVTDLRPIFDITATSIEGAVISHILKIEYAGSSEEDKELFLAVDDSDLDKLEMAVKRARRKSVALQSFARNANLRIIEDNP